MKLFSQREGGQALILVLILLLLGGLMLPPMLSLASTGLKAGQLIEQKTDELYAADAGVEDAIWNTRTPDAPFYDELQALAENEAYSYILIGLVNGVSPINITVKKLPLLQTLAGDNEYKLDQPHEGWVSFGEPQATPNQGEGWVEYTCHVSFHYDGAGRRELKSVGAFFSPFPGDEDLIEGSYGWEETGTGVITFTDLEVGSPQAKIVPGGFVFIWRWATYPTFDATKDKIDGAFDFKFKIYNLDWGYTLYFVWSTFKQQDISYVTNAPGLCRWLIEATAGDTTVRSVVIGDIEGLSILTWEINAP
jgi:hypothetical protein